MISCNKNTKEVATISVEDSALKEQIKLSMVMIDNRESPLDSLKLCSPQLTIQYRSMDIPLVSILNIKNNKRIDIQLLDDEFIDEDEFDDLGVVESNTQTQENEFSLSIEDAFLGEFFLTDEWRTLYTLILLNHTEKQAAKICAEVFLKTQQLANEWLKSLINFKK